MTERDRSRETRERAIENGTATELDSDKIRQAIHPRWDILGRERRLLRSLIREPAYTPMKERAIIR